MVWVGLAWMPVGTEHDRDMPTWDCPSCARRFGRANQRHGVGLVVLGWAVEATGHGQRLLGQHLVEVGELAGPLVTHDRPVVDERHPCGVVAAVLQPAQPVDDHILGRLLSDVPHDSAHSP